MCSIIATVYMQKVNTTYLAITSQDIQDFVTDSAKDSANVRDKDYRNYQNTPSFWRV